MSPTVRRSRPRDRKSAPESTLACITCLTVRGARTHGGTPRAERRLFDANPYEDLAGAHEVPLGHDEKLDSARDGDQFKTLPATMSDMTD